MVKTYPICRWMLSIDTFWRDEYEELFHYTVVTPKFEQCVSKLPEPALEQRPPDRISGVADDASHLSTSVKQAIMEQPAVSEATSSQGSTHGPGEVIKTTVIELTAPDEKVTQIENILDLWSGSLKVINNLSQALEKQKERVELMRKFTLWRIRHVKAKQEEYAVRMADKHFQTALMKKVWAAWHSVSEERWKEKVARACQLRAEDICVQLTNDFEAKIAELTATLEQTKAEILRLHSERDQYEDTMKKAFMRDIGSRRNDNATTGAGRPPPSQYNQTSPPPPPAAALQMENMFSSHLAHASTPETRLDSDSPVIVASTTSGSGVTSTQKLPMAKIITSAQQKPGRTITARITGRADMGQKSRSSGSLTVMGVSPPMSSVIVEKHHPITQPNPSGRAVLEKKKVSSIPALATAPQHQQGPQHGTAVSQRTLKKYLLQSYAFGKLQLKVYALHKLYSLSQSLGARTTAQDNGSLLSRCNRRTGAKQGLATTTQFPQITRFH
ncbi:hypothetical protein IHE44_0011477 [Lamprotornis superbus]|uniref:Centrosomal protein POC5 n=1 Tax=Lamprotornis superbus TaxID=245042 RepID=A0A835NKK4_9PASS|nr:hypothetical protein IHE44_0011477 [Lamprotornis superbus]